MKPYTYYITHKPSGKKYYGVRYAENASPTDLFETYFTSSKYIHSLIESDGIESFEYHVRKIFNNSKDAINWEAKVLRRLNVKDNENWLNRHNGDGMFYGEGRPCGFEHTQDTIDKIRQSNIGKKKPKSETHKKKISETMKDKFENMSSDELSVRMKNSWHSESSWTDTRKKKISDALSGEPKSEAHKRALKKPLSEAHRQALKKPKSEAHKQALSKVNKGRTWEVVDGKRVWFDKGE